MADSTGRDPEVDVVDGDGDGTGLDADAVVADVAPQPAGAELAGGGESDESDVDAPASGVRESGDVVAASPDEAVAAPDEDHAVPLPEDEATAAGAVSMDEAREALASGVLDSVDAGAGPADGLGLPDGDGVARASDRGADVTDDDFKRPAAEVKSIVEALIFASPDPLTPKALLKLLDSEPKEDVLAALDELKRDYERPCGLQLVEVAGGFQIVTRADLHEWVRRLFHERSTQKLSVQALESLAVIAYRQPITAIEITEIRGVNTSGVLNTLLERHLVKIVGRKQVVGRPFMYATTKEFLIRFGLKDLTDLPKVEDMAESLGIESRLLIEQTPPEEQLPLSEPETDDLPYEAVPEDEPAASDDDPTVH